ncbi:chromosome condensation regulator RCC1 [Myxococcaceae bacterium JPH2]|nr:chromosome condensation regulator RCC1 [Myxococcaceae bacterium JPH2]
MKCCRILPSLLLLLLAACGSEDSSSTPGISAPPYIAVLSSVSGTLTQPTVTVTGYVQAGNPVESIEARLDEGEALPVEWDKAEGHTPSFRVQVALPLGDSTLRLDAVDQAGGHSSRSLRLHREEPPDTTAPSVRLVTPEPDQALTVRRVRVQAIATDDKAVAQVSFTLNGAAAQPVTGLGADGALAFDVTPHPGVNTLVVQATDPSGNAGTATVTFHFGSLTSAGGLHTGVVRAGTLYTWGRNNKGQLGLGASVTTDQSGPHAVPTLTHVAAIAFNQNHSLAIDDAGAVWTWGENANGQLGLGAPPAVEGGTRTPDVTPRSEPTRVAVAGAVAGVLGYRHTLVLMEDGTVRAFGDNSNGQLGDGTVTSRDYPVAVVGLTDVVKLAAGSQHSVALQADGTVWTWGRNTYGTLGLGAADAVNHPTPEKVPGVENVVDIATGRDHVLAVHADGTVSAWGLDSAGQLGTGAISAEKQSAVPVKVKGMTDARAVWANGLFGFVRRADGTLMGWGQNGNGQLGLSDTKDKGTPTPSAPGLGRIASLGLGATHVISMRGDNSVYVWGWNSKGSLGRTDLLENWSFPDPLQVVLP